MTEGEWWAAMDSVALADWLFFDARVADRKLRLFCVACCRWTEGKASADVFRELLRTIERFADGEVTEEELGAALRPAAEIEEEDMLALVWSEHVQSDHAIITAAFTPTRYEEFSGPGWRERSWYDDGQPYPVTVVYLTRAPFGHSKATLEPTVIRLLHDIFGPLPFRDIVVSPSWLTSDVRLLAQGIYDDKAFDRMPILADALQDAGCDNEDILSHCRAEGWEHVRGCWVIDLLLGKPWRET